MLKAEQPLARVLTVDNIGTFETPEGKFRQVFVTVRLKDYVICQLKSDDMKQQIDQCEAVTTFTTKTGIYQVLSVVLKLEEA
jgi:hypothetical protein